MSSSIHTIRIATAADAVAVGRLLHSFNTEFGEPSPGEARLTQRFTELYVVPDRRGQALGRALMEAAMEQARSQGADHMDLGTSENDAAARALYESLGFTNREGAPDGPAMLYYERDLR